MIQELTEAGREAREKVLAVYPQAIGLHWGGWRDGVSGYTVWTHSGVKPIPIGGGEDESSAWIYAATRLPAAEPMPHDLSAPAGVERPKEISVWGFGDLYPKEQAEAYMNAQAAEIAHLRAEVDRYKLAVSWTLGESPEGTPDWPFDEGKRFAWRSVLRGLLEAKPQSASLPYTLRANLESALSAFNAARAEDGWGPVTLVIPEGDKPQPEQHPDDAFLQHCLMSWVPDTCRPYCLEAFNAGARIGSRQAKPQPTGLRRSCAKIEAITDQIEKSPRRLTKVWTWENPYQRGYHKVDLSLVKDLRDVVTSLRGMVR